MTNKSDNFNTHKHKRQYLNLPKERTNVLSVR